MLTVFVASNFIVEFFFFVPILMTHFFILVSHKSFPKAVSVMEAIKEQCAEPKKPLPQELTAEMISKSMVSINKFLEGMKIVFQIPNKPSTKRNFSVNGLGLPAKDAKFTLDNGQESTVANYFHRLKGYKIQRADLPCLWVGSKQKKVLVPIEVSPNTFSTDFIID